MVTDIILSSYREKHQYRGKDSIASTSFSPQELLYVFFQMIGEEQCSSVLPVQRKIVHCPKVKAIVASGDQCH